MDFFLHDHDLVLFGNVLFREFPVVEVHLSIHLQVFVLEPNQILIVLVSLQRDRAVVIEKEVEQRDILRVPVILETERLVDHVEHVVPVKPEEHLRSSVLSGLLYLLSHVLDLDVNVLEAPLRLEAQADRTVYFDSVQCEGVVFLPESSLQFLLVLHCFQFLQVFLLGHQI